MAAEWICDGCGKRAPAQRAGDAWIKPHNWFTRSDDDGIQDACSRDCIDRIAERTGKTRLVAPW